MTAVASLAKGFEKGGLPLLIGVGLVAFVVVHYLLKKDIEDVSGSVGEAVSGATEAIGGLATGNNSVTADTPYEGAGVFGTLGAATDAASGGIFSAIGEWIGGTIYESTHDSDNLQSATGNPYSPTGPSGVYREAANNSPTNAQYRASPLVYGDTF